MALRTHTHTHTNKNWGLQNQCLLYSKSSLITKIRPILQIVLRSQSFSSRPRAFKTRSLRLRLNICLSLTSKGKKNINRKIRFRLHAPDKTHSRRLRNTCFKIQSHYACCGHVKKSAKWPHLWPVVLLSQRHELGEPDRHAGCPTLEADLLAVQTQITVEAIRIYSIKS